MSLKSNGQPRVPLVQTVLLKRYFHSKPFILARALAGEKERTVKAVDGVDLFLHEGETLGLFF